jgi:hypothetical protein
MMSNDVGQQIARTARLTLVVLGVGTVLSLLVGLVVGLVIDDLARGIGRSVAVGLSITAVVGVALNLLWRGRR